MSRLIFQFSINFDRTYCLPMSPKNDTRLIWVKVVLESLPLVFDAIAVLRAVVGKSLVWVPHCIYSHFINFSGCIDIIY